MPPRWRSRAIGRRAGLGEFDRPTGRDARGSCRLYGRAHGLPAKLDKDSKGNEIVKSSYSGINFDVYFYDCASGRCSSIQFAAGWTNSNASQARINEWEHHQRYLRVYSKPGKIIWAEQDLVVSRGTTENIDDCLTWWER